MTNRFKKVLVSGIASVCGAAGLYAQGRGTIEWTTSGFDAQRTGWIRSDPRISVKTMQSPGEFGPFKFLWKLKLEHEPKAATALTEPILLDRLIGFRGFKSIAFVGTASETVHAVDIDFGVPLWKYHINYSASPPPVLAAPAPCSGGLTAAMSRPTAIVATASAGGGGGGAGQSGGGVGLPGQGSRTLAVAGRGRGGAPPPPAPAGPPPGTVPGSAAAAAGAVPGGLPGGARQGGPGGGAIFGGTPPFAPGADAAYAVGSDGYLHALNVSNGWDSMTPTPFLPANTRAVGLIVATAGDGSAVAYAATTHGCGSQPDGVWAMDFSSPQKTVSAFTAGGATIAGAAGPTLGRDGTVYVSTMDGAAAMSNTLFALGSKTLTVKASAAVPKADFSSSPLVFQWKNSDAVAVAGNGKLFVFDSTRLQGGPIATAPLPGTKYETRALATWLDAQGTRWIAVPSSRAIATFKVVEQDGKVALQPGWTSRIITAPLTPLVVNGVLFATSSGTRTIPATLYAMDAATGKDLWNSARTMTTTVRSGLSAGSGNVYVPGADGTLYAFGFAIEK
jgi:outer membrane protein assembly factor BamB